MLHKKNSSSVFQLRKDSLPKIGIKGATARSISLLMGTDDEHNEKKESESDSQSNGYNKLTTHAANEI